MYEIELADPTSYRCDCCGGLSVSLTRYVRRAGDAFAVYYAHYANNHPDAELALLISLGDWGSDDVPTSRVAFYCRVRSVNGSHDVMLGDAAESNWSDVAIVGHKLSAEEARAHPWKQSAFEVLDEAFRSDPSLRGYVARAQCRDPRAPLERSFGMPDEVFALGEQRAGRAVVQGPFAQLDKRYFVRVLLDIPVEGYRAWAVGAWVEVAPADMKRIMAAWDQPDAYLALRFSGTLANDIHADLALPVPRELKVEVRPTAANEPPRVCATGPLASLLSHPWSRERFEEYALARGFL